MYSISQCTNLTNIIIPDSVETIEDSAFYGAGPNYSTSPGLTINFPDHNNFPLGWGKYALYTYTGKEANINYYS